MTPEEQARQLIDEKLVSAGWIIQDRQNFDRFAGNRISFRVFYMEKSDKPTVQGLSYYLKTL